MKKKPASDKFQRCFSCSLASTKWRHPTPWQPI